MNEKEKKRREITHNERKREKEKEKKRSTGPSRVVPHRSTTPARTCLTSLFGWEAVSQADMAALKVHLEKRSLFHRSVHSGRGATYLRPLLQSAAGCQPTYLPHRLIRAVAYPTMKKNVTLAASCKFAGRERRNTALRTE